MTGAYIFVNPCLHIKKFGKGKKPEDEGIKSDHFVGKYYIEYDRWARENPQEADELVRKMLKDWEKGEPEVRRFSGKR